MEAGRNMACRRAMSRRAVALNSMAMWSKSAAARRPGAACSTARLEMLTTGTRYVQVVHFGRASALLSLSLLSAEYLHTVVGLLNNYITWSIDGW